MKFEYALQNIKELKQKQNEELVCLLRVSLVKYFRQVFDKCEAIHMASVQLGWESDDEGGSNLWPMLIFYDENLKRLDTSEVDSYVDRCIDDMYSLYLGGLWENLGGNDLIFFKNNEVVKKYELNGTDYL